MHDRPFPFRPRRRRLGRMPSSSRELEHRVADLQLRGVARPLRARVTWPLPAAAPRRCCCSSPGPRTADSAPAPVSSHAGVVVLSLVSRLAPDDLADATRMLEWAADHAAELDADPGEAARRRRGRGRRARRGAGAARPRPRWPTIARQVLIRPELAALRATALAGVAPATVLTTAAADDGRRYAARLRAAGVEVEELQPRGRAARADARLPRPLPAPARVRRRAAAAGHRHAAGQARAAPLVCRDRARRYSRHASAAATSTARASAPWVRYSAAALKDWWKA